MLIRTEAPADILPINALLESVYETNAEAKLVRSLRENSRFTLSLVACNDDGEVIAHLLFTPILIEGDDIGWQGLAPIAVKKEYRNKGIAGKLIKEGFDSLFELGYPVCSVLGDPSFYGRFGFSDAQHFNMHCHWDAPQGYFQIIELAEGACEGKQGLIEYCPEFSEL